MASGSGRAEGLRRGKQEGRALARERFPYCVEQQALVRRQQEYVKGGLALGSGQRRDGKLKDGGGGGGPSEGVYYLALFRRRCSLGAEVRGHVRACAVCMCMCMGMGKCSVHVHACAVCMCMCQFLCARLCTRGAAGCLGGRGAGASLCRCLQAAHTQVLACSCACMLMCLHARVSAGREAWPRSAAQ